MPNSTCSIPECDSAPHQRGWCLAHYTRVRRTGSLDLTTKFTCQVCSVEFEKTGTGPKPKYCGLECKRARLRTPPPKDGRCMGCSATLPPQGAGKTRIYCRPMCKSIKTRRPASRPCSQCGEVIDMTTRTSDGRLRYPAYTKVCESCRKPNRYPLNAIQLADRDGPCCKGCGLEVNFEAVKPDPFSPSVDHIIPWSRGGANIPQNLQLMHLRCNIIKGVKLAI